MNNEQLLSQLEQWAREDYVRLDTRRGRVVVIVGIEKETVGEGDTLADAIADVMRQQIESPIDFNYLGSSVSQRGEVVDHYKFRS